MICIILFQICIVQTFREDLWGLKNRFIPNLCVLFYDLYHSDLDLYYSKHLVKSLRSQEQIYI